MFRSRDGSGSESLKEIPWGWRHHLGPSEIHEEMYFAPVEITKLGFQRQDRAAGGDSSLPE